MFNNFVELGRPLYPRFSCYLFHRRGGSVGEPLVEILEPQSNVVRDFSRGDWVGRWIDTILFDFSQCHTAEFPIDKLCGRVDHPGNTVTPLSKRMQSGARLSEQPSL